MNIFTRRTLAFKALVLILVATAWVLAYSGGPPTAHTGGFGEPTCLECHDSYALNEGRGLGGTFDILGVPDQYTPGQTYTITVKIAQPGQQRWGFELATRFMNDRSQAGTLTATDLDNTQIMTDSGIQYIMHTNNGTFPFLMDGPVQWQFTWTAPSAGAGTVVFSAAGNAADNDSTPQGDYIYTQEVTTQPGAGGE